MELTEQIERAAQVLADPRTDPFPNEIRGYACEYPENAPTKWNWLHHGCKACLIAMMAKFRHKQATGEEAYALVISDSFSDPFMAEFEGEAAIAVARRAIELAPDIVRRERQVLEVVAS